MAGALRGSMPAFEELYCRYAHRIVRFARRLMRDHQDAESITQEVFLRLLKDSAAYDPSRRFSTWIYTIARNLCWDALARRRPDLVGDGDEFPGREPNPAAHMEERETGQRLRAAVDALPQFCREVVQLRVFERFTYREIAQILGCPESTARSRMALAIKRLRVGLYRKLPPSENLVDESSS
ncbi:MAG: sigma-70 family RNA polymerase sigma factor [Planctomycetota bacterium]